MSSKPAESPKMFETKELVHIGTEIITVIILFFYFFSKNKQLATDIQALHQKTVEQDALILKLQESHQKLSSQFAMLSQQCSSGFSSIMAGLNEGVPEKTVPANARDLSPKGTRVKKEPVKASPKPKPILKPSLAKPSPAQLSPIIELSSDSESEDSDAEIKEELKDLTA